MCKFMIMKNQRLRHQLDVLIYKILTVDNKNTRIAKATLSTLNYNTILKYKVE